MKNFIGTLIASVLALFVIDLVPVLSPKLFIGLAAAYAIIGYPLLYILLTKYDIGTIGKGGIHRIAFQAISLSFIVTFTSTCINRAAMSEVTATIRGLNYGMFSEVGLGIVSFAWMASAAVIVFAFFCTLFAEVESSKSSDDYGFY